MTQHLGVTGGGALSLSVLGPFILSPSSLRRTLRMLRRLNEIIEVKHLEKGPTFVELNKCTCSINADCYYLKRVCLKQRLRDHELSQQGSRAFSAPFSARSF